MSTTNSCVFIDTANINASFRKIKSKLGLSDKIKLDFDNLIKIITVGSNLVSKSIYVESRSSDDGSRKFIDFLKHRGFNVITKEIKVISLDNGDKKNKCGEKLTAARSASGKKRASAGKPSGISKKVRKVKAKE